MKKLIGLFVFCAALTWAQSPETTAWWDSPVVQNLNLSQDQQNQIRTRVREYRDRLIEQRAAVQKAEANLQDAMDEDQVNDGRAQEAIDRVVAARGDLLRSISQMSLRLRLVLTPEQWQTLKARRAGQRQQVQQQVQKEIQKQLRQGMKKAPAKQ
jgi:Spy/CpxP family protein refolding chaperone